MAEEKNTPKTFEVLKEDTVVNMTVSFGYYSNMFGVTNYLLKDISEEQINTFYAELKNNPKEFTEEWMYHYKTCLIFLKEFQAKAKEAKSTRNISQDELEELIKKDSANQL
jgi:hypothetical protein